MCGESKNGDPGRRAVQAGVGDPGWSQGADALGRVSGAHLHQETKEETVTVRAVEMDTLCRWLAGNLIQQVVTKGPFVVRWGLLGSLRGVRWAVCSSVGSSVEEVDTEAVQGVVKGVCIQASWPVTSWLTRAPVCLSVCPSICLSVRCCNNGACLKESLQQSR